MHQSKENLGSIVPLIYQHADQQTLHQLYISIVWPHMEHAAPVWDPHLSKDHKTCLKAHRNSHVKWRLKLGTEAMMSSWIRLTYPLLPTEGCTLSYVPCTKLYMTCLSFHQTLLYLKSPDHILYLVSSLCAYQLLLKLFYPSCCISLEHSSRTGCYCPFLLKFKNSLKQYNYRY